jgi:hypothetical protein
MSRLEDELRQAMRRQDPGEDFTRRVLAALERAPEPKPGWRERLTAAFRLPSLRLAMAGALAVLVVVGGAEYREMRTRAEGEAAKQQLLVAMRIAGAKVHTTQMRVLEITEQ